MKGYSLEDCRIILEQLNKDTDWLDIRVGPTRENGSHAK